VLGAVYFLQEKQSLHCVFTIQKQRDPGIPQAQTDKKGQCLVPHGIDEQVRMITRIPLPYLTAWIISPWYAHGCVNAIAAWVSIWCQCGPTSCLYIPKESRCSELKG